MSYVRAGVLGGLSAMKQRISEVPVDVQERRNIYAEFERRVWILEWLSRQVSRQTILQYRACFLGHYKKLADIVIWYDGGLPLASHVESMYGYL